MTGAFAAAYKSGAQRTRVVTEAWGEHYLYCPNCSSPKLDRLGHNTQASDFSCPVCKFWYQLKGQKTRIGSSISDGAYSAMMNAIRKDETPNFFFIHYDLGTWSIRNLLLIPHFAFPPSAIIKRKPLSATARRAGWVGCNISLTRIPVEARISVVTETKVTPPDDVRALFKRVKPLERISVKQRGWTLDVLNAVRKLVQSPKSRVQSQRRGGLDPNEFTTENAYSFTRELESLHPDNRHVKDKIRQQLQVLRDMGLLIHLERGRWRLP